MDAIQELTELAHNRLPGKSYDQVMADLYAALENPALREGYSEEEIRELISMYERKPT
jgi:hypothetical protein